MSEDRFQQLFTKYGKRAFVYKLTDTKEVSGLNKRPVRTKKQPADFLVCVDGDTYLAEVKECLEQTSFPFGNIRENQLAAARRMLAASGQYFFFILRTRTGAWFKVPAKVILDCPKSSLKWTELEPYRYA